MTDRPSIPPVSPLTLDELITLALQGIEGRDLYDAYDRCCRTLANERGQVLGVRENAVLDVIKHTLLFPRPLTVDERAILEGLHHP
jgi:hypothetical protein